MAGVQLKPFGLFIRDDAPLSVGSENLPSCDEAILSETIIVGSSKGSIEIKNESDSANTRAQIILERLDRIMKFTDESIAEKIEKIQDLIHANRHMFDSNEDEYLNIRRPIEGANINTGPILDMFKPRNNWEFLRSTIRFCLLTLSIILTLMFGYFAFLPGVSLLSGHILMVVIAWIILVPLSMNLSYIKLSKNDTEKNKIQWVIQFAATFCIFFGLMPIFFLKDTKKKMHLNSAHGKIGICDTILAVFGLVLGSLICYRPHQGRKMRMVKLLHTLLGITTYILGNLSIILIFYDQWWDGSYIGMCVIIILLIIHGILTISYPLFSFVLLFLNKEKSL